MDERASDGTDQVAWADPRMVDDPRINHDDPDVRRITRVLHAQEPATLHEPYAFEGICIYCARRATLASRTLRASGSDG